MSAQGRYALKPRYEGQVFAIPSWAWEPWATVLEWAMRIGGALALLMSVVAVFAFGAPPVLLFVGFQGLYLFYWSWLVRSTRLGMPRFVAQFGGWRAITSLADDRRPVIGGEADFVEALRYSTWAGITRTPVKASQR